MKTVKIKIIKNFDLKFKNGDFFSFVIEVLNASVFK